MSDLRRISGRLWSRRTPEGQGGVESPPSKNASHKVVSGAESRGALAAFPAADARWDRGVNRGLWGGPAPAVEAAEGLPGGQDPKAAPGHRPEARVAGYVAVGGQGGGECGEGLPPRQFPGVAPDGGGVGAQAGDAGQQVARRVEPRRAENYSETHQRSDGVDVLGGGDHALPLFLRRYRGDFVANAKTEDLDTQRLLKEYLASVVDQDVTKDMPTLAETLRSTYVSSGQESAHCGSQGAEATQVVAEEA